MKVNILIPLAGAGFRFTNAGYKKFKPFIDVVKDSMIREVIQNLRHPDHRFVFVINTGQISLEEFRHHVMSEAGPDCLILTVDTITEGPACSALVAEEYIDNDEPLIIVNCDQIIWDFNPLYIEEFVKVTDTDGFLGCFLSSSKKNSYVKVDPNGEVVEVKEKVVISNLATNGLHYWKHGKYFVESAKEMIAQNDRYNGEFYVAPTYNYMIKGGKKVLPYFFNLHFPIGVPEDLEKYQSIAK
jgi:dTDP-glucose pyrophosphorylase